MFAVSNYNAKGKWKDAILITIELVIVIAKKPESSFNDNHNRSLYIITEIFYFDKLKSQNKITKSQILSSMYTFWLEDSSFHEKVSILKQQSFSRPINLIR